MVDHDAIRKVDYIMLLHVLNFVQLLPHYSYEYCIVEFDRFETSAFNGGFTKCYMDLIPSIVHRS